MICKKCGEVLQDGTRFCTQCGAPVAQPVQSPDPAPAIVSQSYEQPRNTYAPRIKSVGFVEAVKQYFLRYTDFSGRSTRAEYWWVFLFNLIVSGIITAIIPDLSWVWSVATLVPGLSLGVRRMHDIGRSGWWLLIGLIPLAGGIILLVYACTPSKEDNQWGPFPAA